MVSSSPRGSPPPGYREFLYWRITDRPRLVLAMQVLTLPLFTACAVGFFWIALRIGKLPDEFNISADYLLVLILGAFFSLILHELAHGATMQMFGAHPRFGVLWKQLIIYATSPGHAFTRSQFLAISRDHVFFGVVVEISVSHEIKRS